MTPASLLEHLPAVAGSYRLHLDYDEDFLEWLFREMTAVESRGTFVGSLVQDAAGRVLGWYVYYLQPGGISEVMQIAARERDLDGVLDHLLHDAYTHGAAALRGRLEPRLLEPLSRRRCLLRYRGGALIHSREPEILRAILFGQALLTRMDGEWWMGHHTEPFV